MVRVRKARIQGGDGDRSHSKSRDRAAWAPRIRRPHHTAIKRGELVRRAERPLPAPRWFYEVFFSPGQI